MLCNHFSISLIFSGDFATTFCSKIGNVLEMLSRYVPSFSNRCPYFCELPILSRYLRLPRYPIGIVDYGDMYQILNAYLNYAVLLLYMSYIIKICMLYSLEYPTITTLLCTCFPNVSSSDFTFNLRSIRAHT